MRIDTLKQRLSAVKRFLDPPLGPDAAPMEIRAAVLDAVEQKVAVVGIKQRTLPYDRLTVRLLARSADDKAALQPVFADLDARVRERMREVRCTVSPAFDVRVTFLKKPPADWADGQLFGVDGTASAEPMTSAPASAASAPSVPSVKITVVKGGSTRKAYTFEQTVILIGRMPEASDTKGVLRRNHISFDEHASSVSRAHARLKYDAARREFRILDEGSARGTRLLRGDTAIQVPKDPRGVRIQSGDEVHFGEAAIRVTLA